MATELDAFRGSNLKKREVILSGSDFPSASGSLVAVKAADAKARWTIVRVFQLGGDSGKISLSGELMGELGLFPSSPGASRRVMVSRLSVAQRVRTWLTTRHLAAVLSGFAAILTMAVAIGLSSPAPSIKAAQAEVTSLARTNLAADQVRTVATLANVLETANREAVVADQVKAAAALFACLAALSAMVVSWRTANEHVGKS